MRRAGALNQLHVEMFLFYFQMTKHTLEILYLNISKISDLAYVSFYTHYISFIRRILLGVTCGRYDYLFIHDVG